MLTCDVSFQRLLFCGRRWREANGRCHATQGRRWIDCEHHRHQLQPLLHVLEHGLADDQRVQRWQQRLNPVQRAVAGGCHLNRHIPTLVEQAGFTWSTVERWYAGRPRTLTLLTRGVATVV